MSNDEFKQILSDFATRIQFLGQDFAHLVEEFGAYEDEAACAYCGKKGQEEALEDCEHCCAQFCPECWEKALDCARRKKEKTS